MSDKSKFDKDYELLRIAVFWSLLPKTLKNMGFGVQWNGYAELSITVLMASTLLCGVG